MIEREIIKSIATRGQKKHKMFASFLLKMAHFELEQFLPSLLVCSVGKNFRTHNFIIICLQIRKSVLFEEVKNWI